MASVPRAKSSKRKPPAKRKPAESARRPAAKNKRRTIVAHDPSGLSPLDRKRLADAELAELRLAQARGQLIDSDTLRTLLRTVSEVIRATGEQLAQVYGEPARRLVLDGIERLEREGASVLEARK